MELLAHHAMHWPARRTLIVADLHWGKCETFRDAGVPLPAGVIEADLARLAASLHLTGATRLLILGDLLHAGRGLTPRLVELVAKWLDARRVELVLVPGNHDRCGVPPVWNARVTSPEWPEGPFVFRHDPEDNESQDGACGVRPPRSSRPLYTLCGHVHPMVTLAGRVDSLRLPCFTFGPALGILPSFSLFTRGLTIDPTPGTQTFAIANGQIVPLPVSPANPPKVKPTKAARR